MKRIAALVGAAVMLLTIVPATLAASPVKPPSQATASIVGIAAGNPAFSTPSSPAVTCADPAVMSALTSGEPYTVFALTNAASAKLGLNGGNICGALSKGVPTQILLYRVQHRRRFSHLIRAVRVARRPTPARNGRGEAAGLSLDTQLERPARGGSVVSGSQGRTARPSSTPLVVLATGGGRCRSAGYVAHGDPGYSRCVK